MTDEQRAQLKQRVVEALHVYTDYRREGEHVVVQDYLRFAPLDVQPFRHGLSLGVRLERRDGKVINELFIKEAVADYFIDSFEHFMEGL